MRKRGERLEQTIHRKDTARAPQSTAASAFTLRMTQAGPPRRGSTLAASPHRWAHTEERRRAPSHQVLLRVKRHGPPGKKSDTDPQNCVRFLTQ